MRWSGGERTADDHLRPGCRSAVERLLVLEGGAHIVHERVGEQHVIAEEQLMPALIRRIALIREFQPANALAFRHVVGIAVAQAQLVPFGPAPIEARKQVGAALRSGYVRQQRTADQQGIDDGAVVVDQPVAGDIEREPFARQRSAERRLPQPAVERGCRHGERIARVQRRVAHEQ